MQSLLAIIAESAELRRMWDKYRRGFDYASDISYEQVVKALSDICAVFTA
jgi:hypothetical protein